MARITRWHTVRCWAFAACWLMGSVTDVSAQDGRWERVTAAGVQAFARGDYVEAARQFQAVLPLVEGRRPDDGRLATSLLHLAAVYDAQGQYTDAAPLYQRTLVLHERLLGPNHPQIADILEAQAALQRKLHPVRSLLPWSPASKMAARARRIREQAEHALLQAFPWGPLDVRQVFGDGAGTE
jgi:tetratricopeptide (TPR) repeat protein